MNRQIFYLLSIVALSGCGAMGANFNDLKPTDDSITNIYFYRLTHPALFSAGEAPYIFIDNEIKHSLKYGGFLRYPLEPGHHKIKIGKKSHFTLWSKRDIEWEVLVEKNQSKYYRLDISVNGILPLPNSIQISSSVRIIDISEEEALNELSNLNSSM